ncbi:MAG: DUF4838 domain-containing protein [Candidatus Latescibacteria bacterium]|nr:DUF4838 domain-containing protein [Candidatus Latescibacterota bacterium]
MKVISWRKFLLGIMYFFIVIYAHVSCANPGLTILVNFGSFSSVKEAASAEEQVDWWDNNVADDRACTECFAAKELAHFLPLCTTVSAQDIVFQKPERIPETDDVVIIGCRDTNPLVTTKSLPDSIKLGTDQSFSIRAFREKSRTVTIIEGKDRIGTLYGVYGYLKLLGIRFYGLGDNGTVYPVKKSTLPEKLEIVENPDFLTRGYHAWEDRGDETFFLWMVRNRMNFWTAAEKEVHLLKKFGIKLADGGHTIQMDFLNPKTEYPYNHPKFKGDENKPKDHYARSNEYTGDADGNGILTYFEAHPEWYGLYDGKRSDNIKDEFGDNFCTSNRDANLELAKNMIQALIDGKWKYVDIINFWMMDGTYNWCECENCKKQGAYTDRLLAVVDVMLREIRKARSENRLQRDVELSSLAYLETIEPPTRPLPGDFDYDNFSITFFPIERCYDHTFADPSCTEYNQRLHDRYLEWTSGSGRHYKGTMFIGEYYNVSYLKSLPMLYTRILAVDIPWYYHTGTRHFHYMHTPSRLWGTWTLNQYLLAQLLWNSATDSDDLVNEYFHRYYTTTCETTTQFYQNQEKATAGFKTIRYWGWKKNLTDKNLKVFTKQHFYYYTQHPLLNDGIDLEEMRNYFIEARKCIDNALLKCTDSSEKQRLLEDERRFAYGEDMFYFHYHILRTAMFYHSDDHEMARHEFSSLRRYAESLENIVDLVDVSSSHANAKNGFEATQAVDVYNFFRGKYGE